MTTDAPQEHSILYCPNCGTQAWATSNDLVQALQSIDDSLAEYRRIRRRSRIALWLMIGSIVGNVFAAYLNIAIALGR